MKATVKITSKGQASANYQSVHFGVDITVEGLEVGEIVDYEEMLQEMAFERVNLMEPQAQELLDRLAGARK